VRHGLIVLGLATILCRVPVLEGGNPDASSTGRNVFLDIRSINWEAHLWETVIYDDGHFQHQFYWFVRDEKPHFEPRCGQIASREMNELRALAHSVMKSNERPAPTPVPIVGSGNTVITIHLGGQQRETTRYSAGGKRLLERMAALTKEDPDESFEIAINYWSAHGFQSMNIGNDGSHYLREQSGDRLWTTERSGRYCREDFRNIRNWLKKSTFFTSPQPRGSDKGTSSFSFHAQVGRKKRSFDYRGELEGLPRSMQEFHAKVTSLVNQSAER
jgi:hypothetical protein